MSKLITFLFVLSAFFVIGLEGYKMIKTAEDANTEKSLALAEQSTDRLYKEMELNIQLVKKDGLLIPLDDTKLSHVESLYEKAGSSSGKFQKRLTSLETKIFEMNQYQSAIDKAGELDAMIDQFINKPEYKKTDFDDLILLKTEVASIRAGFNAIHHIGLKEILSQKYITEASQLDKY
ncbi:MAG TPA: hypothetical protein DCR24_10875 [Bacillus bacterium]|nr:hypothetical protein [Bacillus sp. (in: firmicutes)]